MGFFFRCNHLNGYHVIRKVPEECLIHRQMIGTAISQRKQAWFASMHMPYQIRIISQYGFCGLRIDCQCSGIKLHSNGLMIDSSHNVRGFRRSSHEIGAVAYRIRLQTYDDTLRLSNISKASKEIHRFV